MRVLAAALICIGFTTSGTAMAAENACVPDPNGEGWRCGTPEEIAQVQPRAVQRPPSATPSSPPAYLLDPNRAPQIIQRNPAAARPTAGPAPAYAAPRVAEPKRGVPASLAPPAPPPATRTTARTPPRPIAPVRTAPAAVIARTPAPTPTPAVIAAPQATAAAAAPPSKPVTASAGNAEVASGQAEQAKVDQNIARLEALTAEDPQAPKPAPVISPEVASAAAPSAPTIPAPAPAPAAPAPAAAPVRPATKPAPATLPATPKVADATASIPNPAQPYSEQFVGWGNREYTIQLVAASSPAEFAAVAARAGQPLSSLYQVRLQQPEKTWWLLCYGRYESLDAAKLALSQLPNDARSTGAWPRRVGPLQAEQSQ